MKSPAEYLTGPVFQLTYPTGEVAESVPVVTYDDALLALEEALADAEEYKYLLLRAIRRNAPETVAPEATTITAETAVVPMYAEAA
ncbi:hypothetical protein GCM10011375_00140 [Hymenobacter qilianensis]|uniref:Uncharacterized protein n=2 Tax=Hymenobacter qilianensis TaxID=1385715 RepID=A0ACB5PKS7_9BACT|nr:hypothetical protein [Hymenobacter qilianensis]QNP51008.1 hypothetical protein H9L05_12800 [Hymenobacter qilianensis]GGF48636.1 hypothetical protein GCM10011375_00140 [Hymenobacter qilianensis]